MTPWKMGFVASPRSTFASSPIERALNSLKIWQKTNALKMSVKCLRRPAALSGSGTANSVAPNASR